MITAHQPLIASADYEAFRAIIKDIPETFDQWQYLHLQNRANYISNGWQAVDVEVDPHEFSRYCNSTDSPHNLHSLDNFAFEKSEGKKY